MFNLNDYRLMDLDDVVRREIGRREPAPGELLDLNKIEFAYFPLLKNCNGTVSIDKNTQEVAVRFSNSLFKEAAVTSFNGLDQTTAERINQLFENLVALECLVTDRPLLRKNDQLITISHLLLSNIETLANSQPAEIQVIDIIGEPAYEKMLAKVKKYFNKEQAATIDSQTPWYDT